MTKLPTCLFLALAAASAFLPATVNAEPACQYVLVAKVPLRYTSPSLSITMEGAINGTPAQMLVDTGAFDTILTKTGTARHGLVLRHTNEWVYGIAGKSRVYSTRVKEFSAGSARSMQGEMQVIGDTTYTPDYDAILGAGFLFQADLEFSLATKEINFFRPLNCGDKFLAYWSRDAIEIPFSERSPSSGNPEFTVVLNGHKLNAVIDSGATTSGIGLGAAKRIGLKMDGPEMVRAGEVVGVGTRRVAKWVTTVDSLAIGDEIIRNARIGVVDDQVPGRNEMVLGADFLRSHRVLFAMSQKKLYISYVGGEPLSQRLDWEPWMQQEADTGNPDAQYRLAQMYEHGSGVVRDKAQAQGWLDKAAASGHAQANLITGVRLVWQGQHAEGALRLRRAFDRLPPQPEAALWLFLARVHGKQTALGKQELAAAYHGSADREWPVPIAHFYLDKIDADTLLKLAGQDAGRICGARTFMNLLYQARGDDRHVQPTPCMVGESGSGAAGGASP